MKIPLPMLPADKAGHFIDGGLIAGVVSVLVHFALKENSDVAAACGLGVAALVGALKEGSDWWQNRKAVAAGSPPTHSVDLMDFGATTAGGLLVAAAFAMGAVVV